MAGTSWQLRPRAARRVDQVGVGWLAAGGAGLAAGGAGLAAGLLAFSLATLGSLGGATPFAADLASAASGQVSLDRPSVPVRIRIPDLGVDLPVVSSERNVPGNREGWAALQARYPLCDVAAYWTIYDLPGAPGTAWIYAHAQPGMFLPMLELSERTEGEGLLGMAVELQLRDGRLLTYRIDTVRERARNRRIAIQDGQEDHLLILQTSVGPAGTVPKLQAGARLVTAGRATQRAPTAQPRACWQSRIDTSPTGNGPRPRPTPRVDDLSGSGEIDAMTIALGTVGVLLGSAVVAVVLVRRQP